MHYFKRNIGDYHKKAGRLSILEHGAYTLLMDACYDREKFPTREEAIEWCWARSKSEIAAIDYVLGKFFVLKDGKYVQHRIAEEIAQYHENAETNRRIALEREAARRAKKEGTETNRTRTVHEPPPNQEPLTINQEPGTNINTDTNVSVIGAKAPPCPHLEIIEAYHRILPELPAVVTGRWANSTRAKNLQARWKESPKHQKLKFWERFFEELRNHPFYMGQNDRGWTASLAWLVERGNFDKMIEKFINASRKANGA